MLVGAARPEPHLKVLRDRKAIFGLREYGERGLTDLDRDCSETACSTDDALQPRVWADRAAFLSSLAFVTRGKSEAFLLPNELLLNNHACRIKVGALLGMERLDGSENVGFECPCARQRV